MKQGSSYLLSGDLHPRCHIDVEVNHPPDKRTKVKSLKYVRFTSFFFFVIDQEDKLIDTMVNQYKK